jgi:hypothetical protein
MDMIIFLTLILATWRVSHLLAHEDGPFEFISTFRYWAGVRYAEGPPYEAYGRNVFSTMLLCMWCNSFWVGLIYTILYSLWHPLWFLALPFALSATAIILEEIFGDEETDG